MPITGARLEHQGVQFDSCYDAAQDFGFTGGYDKWINSELSFTLTRPGAIYVWYNWYGRGSVGRNSGIAARVHRGGVSTNAFVVQGFVAYGFNHPTSLLWTQGGLSAGDYTIDLRIYVYNAGDVYNGKRLYGVGFVVY